MTSYVYDGAGNVIKQIAHIPDGTNDSVQITEYVYGVEMSQDPDESFINTFDLLYQVVYPEGQSSASVSDRTVTYSYNRQGELIRMEDQNGTVHEYARDDLGRVTRDYAAELGTDIDDAVTRIQTEYDALGRVKSVGSSSGGPSIFTAVDGVRFTYTPLWQVKHVEQSLGALFGFPIHDTTVTYTYDTEDADGGSGGNYSRLSSLTYPDGESIDYEYDGINDALSRLSTIGLQAGVHYHYVGMGMTAVVDFEEPNVQLDRTAKHSGERNFGPDDSTAGEYPGYDRFGRVRHHMWVDGAFMPWDSVASLHEETDKPHVPPIVELTHEYDKASNRLNRFDETPTYAWDHRHQEYDYDGLHRLKEARRGIRDGSFAHSDMQKSREWDLDTLGNWRELLEWDTSSYATVEERDHSDANELTQITVDTDELELTYDKAGNLIEQDLTPTSSVTYIYDAWNRLVRVTYGSSDRAKYRYNGLNWRIEKHADTSMPPDGDLNQRREMYYSANWQLLEERIDDDALAQEPEVNRHMQYIWGPRYIDDIIARRQNSDFENDDPDITYEDVWYHLTDAQFSTVAIIDEGASVVERVSYDAYGRARHHRGADLDGDGDVDTFDHLAMQGNWGEYGLGDVDRNGIVNTFDQLELLGRWGAALEPGQLSITDNQIGYAGYVFNAELHGGGLYTVRFRVYSPDLGRWLTRDPLGYVDGMGLYEYVASRPLIIADPEGLCGISLGASDEAWQHLQEGREYRLLDRGKCCDGKRYYPDIECCEDGKVVGKVSLWYCTRALDPTGMNLDFGPLHHAFVLCEAPQNGKVPQNDDGTFYGFGKQPRKLFIWDCEKGKLVVLDQPRGLRRWAWGPGFVDWETHPVDASRCSERKVCPKDKERMCQRGPTERPYFFFTTNCQSWAQCENQ